MWQLPPKDGGSGTIVEYLLVFSTCRYSSCNRRIRASGNRYEASQLTSGVEYTISITACTTIGCGYKASILKVTLPEEGNNIM
jgi:hypothetical protein